MEEDTEYLKLSLEDRCVHKLWKARVSGYEECSKLFAKITDDKSPEFAKFAPLIKRFVTDSNAVAQEKALDAVLIFAENAHVAGKTAADATAGIVAKCFSAPKKSTQEKALDVILMYCEIEKHDAVQEELIKGFAQKNPKVVCGCIKAISTALREFGSKVINIKSLVKSMGTLLEDRDKNVREEAKKMVIEMYRWVGPALKPQLTSLKPIQIQELEAEFEKMSKVKPIQSRFLRSQQEQKAKAEIQDESQEDGEEEEEDKGNDLDPFELITPVNILEKLPADFYEQVEAKKWQDRKSAMGILLPLSQNVKLEAGDYGDLVKALRKIIAKDTNVMIIALAGQCLCGIAKGLKKKFSPYVISCLETVLEKFKEKKINVVVSLRDAADAIFQSTSIEAIQEIACASLNNKNPSVKAETASFLARSFCYCTPAGLSKKVLKVYVTELLKTLNESDSVVRESSAEALGTALKVVGEKAMAPFIADIEALKMQKIKEFSEKVEIKVKIKPVKAKPAVKAIPPAKEPVVRGGMKPPPPKVTNGRPTASGKKPGISGPGRVKKPGVSKVESDFYSEDDLDQRGEDAVNANDNDMTENGHIHDAVDAASDDVIRSNISAQIDAQLISELADKNWKVRIEALGKVSVMLTNAKHIDGDIGELPEALCNRLSDTNKNIAAEALKITGQLAAALGPHCKTHTRILVPGIFAALGDTKKSMRDQALATLNDWVKNLGSVKDVVDGEMCIDALKSGSPFLKTEVMVWLSEMLREAPPKSLNKEELHGCIDYLFSGLEDRNADIRKASNEAIFPFMLHLGYDAMVRHTSKVKPSSKNIVMQALDKAKPNLPSRPASVPIKKTEKTAASARPASSTSRPAEKTEKCGSGGVGRTAKKVGVRSQSAPKPAARKEEDVDTSPLLQLGAVKQQRMTEEQRMRTLRWDFSTPRLEFVQQLKQQMTAANLNRQLLTNMFHQDFRFHIKAIDALAEDLNENVDACIANLDLVLRWLTIRFFDTNPSVILKAMDYLSAVFSVLSENEYKLMDYEAYSFLPFLIMKFGDPKDAIRGPTKNIVKLICNIYPASKVSPYLLDGLKSKNARQRAECLESLGSLIEDYGMSVCQPSPTVSLKEVAKQVADRDNAVRNAALNCLLQVYFRQGEKIYKLIGQITDKDHSLLEERIKRAAKNKPIIKKPAVAPEVVVPVAKGAVGGGVGKINRVVPTPSSHPPPVLRSGISSKSQPAENENTTGIRRYYPISSDRNANSAIQIDYDFIEKLIEEDWTSSDWKKKYQLEEIPDIDTILKDDTPATLPTSRLTKPGFASTMRANVANANVDLEGASRAINMVISQVASQEVNTVITALSQIVDVIQSEEQKSYLIPHIDQMLIVARFQYRHVLNTKMADESINKEECIRIIRSLTCCLLNIFDNKDFGMKASSDVLRDVIHVIITMLLDSRLSSLEDGPKVVRALNVLAVRIIEKANFTNLFSALLKLLNESVGSGGNAKFTELVMKCNWKAIKILSSKSKELNPVQILQDVNEFMLAFPPNTWASRPSNTPLLTIKTVIHHLGKVYGYDLLNSLSQVPNSEGSELQKYIIKNLNNSSHKSSSSDGKSKDTNKLPLDNSNNETESVSGKAQRKLSKSAYNTLSEIFRKIGSKENTKDALVQLYEFKERNPDVDIDSYLRKSSQFFQNYIEQGLKKVEMERQGETKLHHSSGTHDVATGKGSLTSIHSEEAYEETLDGLLEQAKAIATLAGLDHTKDPGTKISIDSSIMSSLQDAPSVTMSEMVDQFKSLAAKAGFDNSYIESAVKNIYSKESKESRKSLSSDLSLTRTD